MDEETKERIGFNEAAFRKVNEAVRSGRGLADTGQMLQLVCECGRLGCNRLIELTVAEYEHLRANPRCFAIVDGHELTETETVLERNERYTVVEKFEAGARVAEGTDPAPDAVTGGACRACLAECPGTVRLVRSRPCPS